MLKILLEIYIYVEPASSNEGARCRLWGSGIAKRGDVFKTDDDVAVASPNAK